MKATHNPQPQSTFTCRTLWLSDIHLGNRDCHADYLLNFLQHVRCERLYLVGDIIDMLAMKQRVHWPQSHTRVLQHFYRLANDGVEVIYIPGNHDLPMRQYHNGMLLNVQLYRHCIHTTEKGKRLLVVHGDEFDHAVLYRAMNRLIGDYAYGLMVLLNRSLHRIRRLFGLPYWSLANYLKENIAQARNTIEAFEEAAAAEAHQRRLDGVVCGHIHRPQLRTIDGMLYCNDGDWTESCSALVEHTDGELELLDWEKIQALMAEQDKPHLHVA